MIATRAYKSNCAIKKDSSIKSVTSKKSSGEHTFNSNMSGVLRFLIIGLAIGGGLIYHKINNLLGPLPAPQLPLDAWWGDDERPKDWKAYVANTSEIVPNKIIYPDATIENLKSLLNGTLRLQEPLEGVAFEYGFNTAYLRKIVDYWRDDYLPRWREREVFLWQFTHLTTDIQGLRMHFFWLQVYDEHKANKHHYPILLLHGWPGSVREFYELIHKLHQKAIDGKNDYVFDVIVPSLPGFAWSQGTSKQGMGPAEQAVILRNLMARLGYKKYFIQGGDWGSLIGSHMATLYPENVLGFHSNVCFVQSGKALLKGLLASMLPSFFAPKGFEDFYFPLSRKLAFALEETGYVHLQATKPDTIGGALTGNPIGLAAYILEKFSTWTNADYRKLEDGGLTKKFKLDALLDNVMIYYLTNSITTSSRLYAEAFSQKQLALNLARVPTTVPTGCARFKHDLLHQVDYQLRDKYPNLIHSTHYRDGGHFAAMETPQVLYSDLIEFIKKVEKFSNIKK